VWKLDTSRRAYGRKFAWGYENLMLASMLRCNEKRTECLSVLELAVMKICLGERGTY
jgi:hypothetical protein